MFCSHFKNLPKINKFLMTLSLQQLSHEKDSYVSSRTTKPIKLHGITSTYNCNNNCYKFTKRKHLFSPPILYDSSTLGYEVIAY